MARETNIPEKEIGVIKVTLDEIENAIEGLSVTTGLLSSVASNPKYRLTAEGIKEVAAALDKNVEIALNSMMLLYAIMQHNGHDNIAGIAAQNCTNNKFCGYCQHYQPDKNTHICTNEKSENFNVNTAPFQYCNCFSENKTHTAKEVIKNETIV